MSERREPVWRIGPQEEDELTRLVSDVCVAAAEAAARHAKTPHDRKLYTHFARTARLNRRMRERAARRRPPQEPGT